MFPAKDWESFSNWLDQECLRALKKLDSCVKLKNWLRNLILLKICVISKTIIIVEPCPLVRRFLSNSKRSQGWSKHLHFWIIKSLKWMFYNIGHQWLGWIPRNFKIFIFKPKLSFLLKNHKNDSLAEPPDFCEFTLYMIFKI